MEYDVAIIGAGVIGCSIARELAKYRLRTVLIEKGADVANGTSGANSGVVHSGFKEPPGSLKAATCVEGNRLFPKLCNELGVPFKRIGTLVVANNKDELPELKRLMKQGKRNAVKGLIFLNRNELKKLEPNVKGIRGLLSKSGAITTPYLLTIALAENALCNGVEIRLNTEVTGISKKENCYELKTTTGLIKSEIVINSAGVHADKIAAMAGANYSVYPNRGEYHILDKIEKNLINTMVYPVTPPRGGGVGIHLTPTIEGNILIGPTACYVDEGSDVATTKEKMSALCEGAKKLVPTLNEKSIITSFSAMRTKTVRYGKHGKGDFLVEERPKGFINLIGIESPGLTSSPVLARIVSDMVKKIKEPERNPKFEPLRKQKPRFDELSEESKAKLIKKNPNNGEIICRCENVTKQEVLDALNNPLGVATIRGIKLRCRATMGRCQGGFCTPRIVDIMQELGIHWKKISLKGAGSAMFSKTMK